MSLICFAFSKNYFLSILLLVPVGFAVMLQMASSNTLIQSMVPDDFRGRTMAVYSMMFMGMAPLGSLFAGGNHHSPHLGLDFATSDFQVKHSSFLLLVYCPLD